MTTLADFDAAFAHRYANRPEGWGQGDRWPAFRYIAAYLLGLQRPVTIVETGTARGAGNWLGDGQSTLLWDWIVAHVGGRLDSVDIDAAACDTAHAQMTSKESRVWCADSIYLLRSMADDVLMPDWSPDLVFLDSYDYDFAMASPLHHVGELAAVAKRLQKGALVAVDDCHERDQGKQVLVADYFERAGKVPLVTGYVTVWEW